MKKLSILTLMLLSVNAIQSSENTRHFALLAAEETLTPEDKKLIKTHPLFFNLSELTDQKETDILLPIPEALTQADITTLQTNFNNAKKEAIEKLNTVQNIINRYSADPTNIFWVAQQAYEAMQLLEINYIILSNKLKGQTIDRHSGTFIPENSTYAANFNSSEKIAAQKALLEKYDLEVASKIASYLSSKP